MIKGEHASCVSVIKRWLEGVAARGAQYGAQCCAQVGTLCGALCGAQFDAQP